MQKIFRLLLVAAAIILGVLWFAHWSRTRALNSGAVHVRNQPPDSSSKSPAPETASGNPAAPDQPAPAQETASASPEAPPSAMVPQQPGPISTLPAGDTLSPHPPSGFNSPSAQKYALYRQGDLTYRLNTQSGQACVLLATDTLWRKPLVYQHGCGATR
jgi:hypothetical protein